MTRPIPTPARVFLKVMLAALLIGAPTYFAAGAFPTIRSHIHDWLQEREGRVRAADDWRAGKAVRFVSWPIPSFGSEVIVFGPWDGDSGLPAATDYGTKWQAAYNARIQQIMQAYGAPANSCRRFPPQEVLRDLYYPLWRSDQDEGMAAAFPGCRITRTADSLVLSHPDFPHIRIVKTFADRVDVLDENDRIIAQIGSIFGTEVETGVRQ